VDETAGRAVSAIKSGRVGGGSGEPEDPAEYVSTSTFSKRTQMRIDIRKSEPDTVGGDGNEERTSVDQEESEVSSGEYDSPP